MAYTNSSLVVYKKLSPNYNVRNHAIDTISIHCMAGNISVESCGALFAKSSQAASSNYGIGADGRIALYVEEKNRSWCTSSRSNDHRAVTIEVASDSTAPYKVTDKAYNALINLCADICKRNGIKKLLWKGDKSLIGQVDKQNMTVHRWFANKACPGDYLYNLHGQIAEEVNKKLGVSTTGTTSTTAASTSTSFTVKILDDCLNIRKGAGTSYAIVGQIKDHGVYTIVQTVGTVGKAGSWGLLKSYEKNKNGWISLNSCYVKKL